MSLQHVQLFDELDAQRRRMSVILDNASDGIFLVDGDGTVQSWNPAMEQLTGRPEDQAVGAPLAWCSVASSTTVSRSAPPGCSPPCRGARALRAHPHRRGSRARRVPRPGDGRGQRATYAVVVARDITAQREVQQAKEDFIATVSHELRTPLTPIKGYVRCCGGRATARTRRVATRPWTCCPSNRPSSSGWSTTCSASPACGTVSSTCSCRRPTSVPSSRAPSATWGDQSRTRCTIRSRRAHRRCPLRPGAAAAGRRQPALQRDKYSPAGTPVAGRRRSSPPAARSRSGRRRGSRCAGRVAGRGLRALPAAGAPPDAPHPGHRSRAAHRPAARRRRCTAGSGWTAPPVTARLPRRAAGRRWGCRPSPSRPCAAGRGAPAGRPAAASRPCRSPPPAVSEAGDIMRCGSQAG